MKLTATLAYEIKSEANPPILYTYQTVSEALWVLFASNMAGLPVCDKEDYLVGFLSRSDIAQLSPTTSNTVIHKTDSYIQYVAEIPDRTFVDDLMTTNIVTAQPFDPVEQVLKLLTERHTVINKDKNNPKQHITSVPLVSDGRFAGIITYLELLKKIEYGDTRVRDMMTVEDVLIVASDDTLKHAKALMDEFKERFVLVVNNRTQKLPVGVLSDVQIIRHMQNADLRVKAAMTDLQCFKDVFPTDYVEKIVPLFVNPYLELRALPVIENGKLRGMISYIDILQYLLQSREPALTPS